MGNSLNVCNGFDVINQVEKTDKGKASSETKPTPKDFATGQGLKGILKKEGSKSFRKQPNEVQESSSRQTSSNDVNLRAESSKRYGSIEEKKQKSKVRFQDKPDIREINDTSSAKEIMEIHINDLKASLEDLQRNYKDLGKRKITLEIGKEENKIKYIFTQKDINLLNKSSKKIIEKCKKNPSQENFENIKNQSKIVEELLGKLRVKKDKKR